MSINGVSSKINRLKNWQVAILITCLGFAIFFSGLRNPFQYDDLLQIVNNPVVHSLSHIRLLFVGGTFYAGHGIAPLAGAYYRPLMEVVFSLLYSAFGSHPIYFHIFQLLLYIAGVYLLYLIFCYSFKPVVSLFLSLLFLVHPINSGVFYSIACMQDVLFFFFGMLALWILFKFSSKASFGLVALCLLLSLLSKETAVLFIILSLLFLFWWGRKQFWSFASILAIPIVIYLILRVHAIGLLGPSPNNAPLLRLGLFDRLLTAPSILLFYITKFIWPLKLATGYYWAYRSFSVSHVLLPLIIDLAVVGLFIWAGSMIKRRASRGMYHTYLFFATWCGLGILTTLQIIPLDMTASESWFYFPMAGLLGMIGVILTVFPIRINKRWLTIVAILLISILGLRSAVRGLDYRSPEQIAYKNISASKEDWVSYDEVASYLILMGQYSKAEPYVEKSIHYYPCPTNYNLLGDIFTSEYNFMAAKQAYDQGLKYGSFELIYDGLGKLTMFIGSPNANKAYLEKALREYPQDSSLWLYLAILEDRYGQNASAKVAVIKASEYGQVPKLLYQDIYNNKPFSLNLGEGHIVTVD